MALSRLKAEFDARLPILQGSHEPIDWMKEIFDSVARIYDGSTIATVESDGFDSKKSCQPPSTGIRAAFLDCIHTARCFYLQYDRFDHLLDANPAFALDLFRNMRRSGDFVKQPSAERPKMTKRARKKHTRASGISANSEGPVIEWDHDD